jgi:hypothetical protein
MKNWKLMAVCAAALTSAFTMTSCLDSDTSDSPDYYNVPVTVSSSSLYGTVFYADFQKCTLVPTSSSLANLNLTNVKRAIVTFSFVDSSVATTGVQEGQSYNVSLYSSYCYGIPTYNIVDDYQNEAADSLATTQTGISSISTSTTWVANGYLTTQLTLPYSSASSYSMTMLYNSAEDVDADNNTLTLNLQYNHNATNAYNTGSSYFSFKMPSGIANKFSADSVNVVLRALSASGTDNYLTTKTKVARTDLTSKY